MFAICRCSVVLLLILIVVVCSVIPLRHRLDRCLPPLTIRRSPPRYSLSLCVSSRPLLCVVIAFSARASFFCVLYSRAHRSACVVLLASSFSAYNAMKVSKRASLPRVLPLCVWYAAVPRLTLGVRSDQHRAVTRRRRQPQRLQRDVSICSLIVND